jgi:hypothetical protein
MRDAGDVASIFAKALKPSGGGIANRHSMCCGNA